MQYLKYIAFSFFLVASVAHAAPVSWDGNTGTGILQPLQAFWSALVKGYSFQATSTTVANIFPLASTTVTSADSLCLTGDLPCRTTWPTSGGGEFPFTPTNYGVSTSTTVGFLNGLLSTASSTFTSTLTLSNYTDGALGVDATGSLYTFATSTWTFASSTLLSDNNTWTGLNIFGNASTTILSADTLCLTADLPCRTTWPTGGGSDFPFTPTNYGVSTSTTVGFLNGLLSTASSTFTGDTHFPGGIWNTSGDVGIGTTSPTYKLSIFGADYDARAELIAGVDGDDYGFGEVIFALYNGAAAASRQPLFSFGAEGIYTDAGNLSTHDFYIYDAANSAYRLFIDTDGDVGIGTTTPAALLDVYGGLIHVDNTGLIQIGVDSGSGVDIKGNGFSYLDLSDARTDDYDFRLLNLGNSFFLRSASVDDIFVATSAGNVGIGSSTPGAKLAVNGSTYLAGSLYATSTVQLTNYTNGGLGVDGAGNLYTFATSTWTFASSTLLSDNNTWTGLNVFGNASTTQLSVSNTAYFPGSGIWNSSGNVGIGETAPGSKLSVSGGATIGASYDTTAAPTNGLIVQGNVGIGTNGPAAPLDVAGTYSGTFFSNFSPTLNGSGTQMNLRAVPTFDPQGTGQTLYSFNTNSRIGGSTSNNVLNLISILAQSQFVDTWSGNATNVYGVLANGAASSVSGTITNSFGFSAADPGVDGATLTVSFHSLMNSGTGKYGLYFPGTAVNYLGGALGIEDSTPTEATLVVGNAGAGNIYATFASANTATLCWDNSGASLITACTSLAAHKDNVTDLTLGTDTLLALTPRRFTWKSDGALDAGFIAEEVAAVEPLLAQYSRRDTREDMTDNELLAHFNVAVTAKEGKTLAESKADEVRTLRSDDKKELLSAWELSGVKYNSITALLVKGFQELIAKITGLEDKLNAQEKRIEELEARLTNAGL